jgi:hypothetical protein
VAILSKQSTRKSLYRLHPELLTRQLGTDLYRSAADALAQLIANSLDAGSSRVLIEIDKNEFDTPDRVTISDDGSGMTPDVVDLAFSSVGHHLDPKSPKRAVIGLRGIGRFAIHALAVQSHWVTVAATNGQLVRQSWDMDGRTELDVQSEILNDGNTGTVITFLPRPTENALRLFLSVARVKRELFNSFASYLLRYRQQVQLFVNGELVDPDDYIERRESEAIDPTDELPSATIDHLVLGPQVEQSSPSVLLYATHGASIASLPLDFDSIDGRKYLGLIDSPYLSDLTNTAKSELPLLDDRFRALHDEVTRRAKRFITAARGDSIESFIAEAQTKPYYPYKDPPTTLVDTFRKTVFDGVLASIEENVGIRHLPHRQMKLIFNLIERLPQSDDLASILTSVLDLKGEHVTRLADLLRKTSLTSIIAVMETLVSRLQFLNELRVLVYGAPAPSVLERRHLHRIVANHTWLFGEQYNLMSSDKSVNSLLPIIKKAVQPVLDDDDATIDVEQDRRDIPDLYLMSSKWNEGACYQQHLVVELKAPSVSLVPRHVEQLERYAAQIVSDQIFGQRRDSHRFTFILVSSKVSDRLRMTKYQQGEEPGLLSRPSGFGHPTELWALQWSDYLDRRTGEMRYLQDQIELTTDPETLDYLKSTAGKHLPESLLTEGAAAT